MRHSSVTETTQLLLSYEIEWNFETEDLMKRTSQSVQGHEPLSEMLTRSVWQRQRTTEGWPIPDLLYSENFKIQKSYYF